MEEKEDNLELRIRRSFDQQGFMRTIGAELLVARPGEVEIGLRHLSALTQQHGYVHGAVVAAVGDTACGYSALTLMPEGAEVVSVEYKVNFIAPARGDRFLARGRVLKSGRSLSVCAGDVFAVDDNGERLIASLQATMMRVMASNEVAPANPSN